MLSLKSPKIPRRRALPQTAHQEHVHQSGQLDPDEAALYDAYDNSAYWCVSTQTGFGPDGEPVRADLCCGERGCCKL